MDARDDAGGARTLDETEPVPADEPGAGPVAAPRRRVARRAVLVALVVLVVLLAAAGWLAFRGYQAATALQDARTAVAAMQRDLDAHGASRLGARLAAAQDATARADAASHDPVWRVATHLPRLGAQLAAVSTISAALDDVTHRAMPAAADLTDLLGDGSGIRDAEGRIDLAPLAKAAPALADAAAAARAAQADVAAIDTTRLVGPLVDPVEQAGDALDRLAGLLDGGSQAAALLPPMLGADGPRTYLVAALNSAELRAAGGIVGSLVLVHADDGKLTIGTQKSTDDLRPLGEPVLPLTPAELTIVGTRLGRWVQNSMQTPEFPRSAQLLVARWKLSVGDDVDGVIATDPVAVAALLKVVGPVTVPDGGSGTRLTSSTLLPTVLRDSYVRHPDPVENDRFFTAVAATIFGRLTSQSVDTVGLVEAAAKQGAEGRIRIWSAHPEEQARLATTPLAGAFLTGGYDDATGVFLDDGTAGKLDYYLTASVTVQDLHCDGPSPTATVQLDLDYRPPADVATLPRYVTGTNPEGLPVGWLATNVTVYAPVGAPLGALHLDAGYVSGVKATEAGRNVQVVTSWMPPDKHETYRFDVPVRDGRVSVWTTPTLTGPGFVAAACDPAAPTG